MPKKEMGQNEFVVMMAALMSVVAISIDATLPALGVIGESLKVAHPNHAQYVISCIFAGMAFGQLLAGPLSDSLGRRAVLFSGLAAYLAGSVVCLLAQSIEVMLLGRVIQGLGVSGPYISVMSIVRDKFSGRAMAKVMSMVMMIFIMVPTLAPALGQAILLLGSWRWIFAFYVFYAVIVGIWVAFRLGETLHPEDRVAFRLSAFLGSARVVLSNRATMCYTVSMGCMFGAMIGYLNSCQQIFQVQYGVGKMFVVYFGVQALAFGVSSLVNSRIVEKYGMRHICLRALLALLVASGLFAALDLAADIELWMFVAYSASLMFGIGLLFGNLNALALEPMGHVAGTAAAVTGAFSSVLSIIFGTTIGQMYDGTLFPVVTGFCVLCALALAFMFLAEKRGRSSPA